METITTPVTLSLEEAIKWKPELIPEFFKDGKNRSRLTKAVENNELDLVKTILDSKIDIDIKGKYGSELLRNCVKLITKTSSNDMLKLLLDSGANIDDSDYPILFFVCGCYGINYCNTETIKIILDSGVDVNSYGPTWPCLFKTITNMKSEADIETLKLFLNHKDIDINITDKYSKELTLISFALSYLCRHFSNKLIIEIFSMFLEKGYIITSYDLDAVKDTEIKQYLIKHQKSLEIKKQNTKTYYGIISDTKLTINFPNITEKEIEDKYYYLYKLSLENNKSRVPNTLELITMGALAENYDLDTPYIYNL